MERRESPCHKRNGRVPCQGDKDWNVPHYGITLGTISLTTVQGLKLHLERISTPRPEEAAVLHSMRITLPRPKTRLERVELTLAEERDLFESQQV